MASSTRFPWQSAWPDSAAKLRGSRRQDGGDLSDLQIMRLCFKGVPTTAASFCPPSEFHGVIPRYFFVRALVTGRVSASSFFDTREGANVLRKFREILVDTCVRVFVHRFSFFFLFLFVFVVGKFFGKNAARLA